jgi:hypothetical protein
MVNYTLRKKKIRGATNSTFLAIIQKESNPSSFSRFRPISLCNSSYKIISKIIANRLKPLLASLISINQRGFLANMKILDNIVLVQEAIFQNKIKKDKGMVIKLDMENIFDKVKHSFLFRVMEKLGFDKQFIKWVQACIKEPWIAPIVNGGPTSFFKESRGVRKGFPLSPLLYIMVVEALSNTIEHERRNGKLPSLPFGSGVKEINHSQLVDDTLLLAATSSIIAKGFKCILQPFLKESGGKINNHKSIIYGWNIQNNTLNELSNILGFPHLQVRSSFKYLGMSISSYSLKAHDWNHILEKMVRRIKYWGAAG